MKKLELKNPSYEYLEKAYREWLDILGYSAMSVYNLPHLVREFFHFLEQNGKSHITQLQTKDYQNYFHHISSRANQRRGGGLSNNYLNKHIQAIEKLIEFLNHKGTQNIPALSLPTQTQHPRNHLSDYRRDTPTLPSCRPRYHGKPNPEIPSPLCA